MELWEFNAYVSGYNQRHTEEQKEKLFYFWRAADFIGAAVWGKLKPFKHYVSDGGEIHTAPQISNEEFEEKLKLAKEAQNQ